MAQKLGDFKGAATTFVKRYAELMAQHYPNRSKMIVVLNAPFFFTAIWKVASKTLDAETRGKVVIWKRPKAKRGKRKTSRCIELERYVTLEEQPRCYGHPWKSAYQWGQAPEHLALLAWVEQIDAGMKAATRNVEGGVAASCRVRCPTRCSRAFAPLPTRCPHALTPKRFAHLRRRAAATAGPSIRSSSPRRSRALSSRGSDSGGRSAAADRK